MSQHLRRLAAAIAIGVLVLSASPAHAAAGDETRPDGAYQFFCEFLGLDCP